MLEPSIDHLEPCLAAMVMAWHFAGTRERRWAAYSVAVGLLIVVFFIAGSTASAMDANGTWRNAPTGFFQRIAIIAGWTWIAMVALHLTREDRRSSIAS